MVLDTRFTPHTPEEIVVFSKEVGISLELAKKVDMKREWHMLWEWDYIKHNTESDLLYVG